MGPCASRLGTGCNSRLKDHLSGTPVGARSPFFGILLVGFGGTDFLVSFSLASLPSLALALSLPVLDMQVILGRVVP